MMRATCSADFLIDLFCCLLWLFFLKTATRFTSFQRARPLDHSHKERGPCPIGADLLAQPTRDCCEHAGPKMDILSSPDEGAAGTTDTRILLRWLLLVPDGGEQQMTSRLSGV